MGGEREEEDEKEGGQIGGGRGRRKWSLFISLVFDELS